MSNVVALPSREPRASNKLRVGVPPFDPANPCHLRAWESVWKLGEIDSARAVSNDGGDRA